MTAQVPTPEPTLRPEASEGQHPLETALPAFSINRRVTVLVLVLTLAVLGVVALMRIPIELIPTGFSQPFLGLAVPWPDAPPQEVLDKVALPLEEEVSTVRGLDNVYTWAGNGRASLFMTFKLGTDMDVAYREVRDRIERARSRMPDDVEQVFIQKHDASGFPVAMMGLAIEEGTADVYNLIEDEIKRPLERLEGVALVEVQGLEQKEILIELDRERLEATGLNIYQIAQDLARDNFSLASGNIRSGDRKLLLRSVARYRTPESVGAIRVAPNVRLSDVARVTYDEPEKDYMVRVNGRPAYAMMIMKEGDANTLEVADRVKALRDRLRQENRLKSMQIDLIMNQGEIIRTSLATLLSSGRVGAILAMIVLFFFLRRFRLSMIIALSIPLSMVVALVVMYFAGETLNVLSLLGLMISVGLLVDNAVVVAENIHRIHRGGEVSRRVACIRGAGEISMAITTATLTTIVVFLPVALVEGQGQFFLLRLAIPISVSLAASLLVALLVIPLAVYLTLPTRDHKDDPTRASVRLKRGFVRTLRRLYEKTFGLLNSFYGRALTWCLQHRLESIVLIAAVLALTQWAAKERLDVVAMSEDEQAFFEIDVDLPDNITFEEGQAWFLAAEKEILELNEQELDLEFFILVQQRSWGEIQGALRAGDSRPPRQMVDKILEILPEMPGIEFETGQQRQGGDEDQKASHTLTLYGEEAETLDRLARELETTFVRLPGVIGRKGAGEDDPNELALVLDRQRAQRQGVDPQTVAGVVSYALRGQPLPRIYQAGREIPVRVRFEEEDRQGLGELGDFSVPTHDGGAVALGTLVDVEKLPTATRIYRQNKRTAKKIVLELEEGKEDETRERIEKVAASIDLPEGISFGDRPRFSAGEELGNLMFAVVLSIVFVYLLMGFLFESFLLPMAILVTIPLANVGVTWIHVLTGTDLDFLGLVGMIILIGVVVNNGIVLLDYVRRLREREGLDRLSALCLATERRFRPIMMTALTTVCGMVPLLFGGGGGRMGLGYTSFALTLIGGMITASLLTLLVVPLSYTLFEDLRDAAISTFLRGLRGQSTKALQPQSTLTGIVDP